LENKKKSITNFPKSVLKRKNIVEEGGASSLRVKREKENIMWIFDNIMCIGVGHQCKGIHS
jgi:hypothetical protein